MSFKSIFLSALFLLSIHLAQAQRYSQGYNYLGITGGVVLFDLNTSDLSTKSETGFMFGFTTRGAFYNDFDLIYGISFVSSRLSVEGKSPSGKVEEIGYTIQGAQLNFLGSYNVVVNHLSFEFGPILDIHGKMKLDKNEFENHIISGHESITAKSIQDISMFDIRLAGGATVGMKHFRLSAQYHYGFLNVLNGLNDKDLGKDNFKGNTSTIVVAATVYF
ncbi:MAG TPA: outer membrane beta-barrel protein [Aequorivita sp.]|nr:outer membrane beta-barrel protein [Aequorivita sp.]